MNVLGIIKNKISACEFYRCTGPLALMGQMGHYAKVLKGEELLQQVEEIPKFWLKGAGGKKWDVVMFQRLTSVPGNQNFAQLVLALRGMGIVVTVDYDDDYTNEHRKVHDGSMPDLSIFSAITVSTPKLRKIMLPYNRHVSILPNGVVPEMFNHFKRVIPHLTIGLTGSTTHKEDWKVVYQPILNVLAKHPEVRLFMTGLVPPNMADHNQVITLKKLYPHLPDNPWLPLNQYGGILMNTDIQLCPVDPGDPFNFSKSNIKATEAMISPRLYGTETGGAAVIATGDIPNYVDAVVHERTGLLVNHFDQVGWEQAISRLVEDSSLRAKLGIAGYKRTQKFFTLESLIAGRIIEYERLTERDSKPAIKERNWIAANLVPGANSI